MADGIARTRQFVCGAFIATVVAAGAFGQGMTKSKVTIRQVPNEFAVGDLDSTEWKRADKVRVSTYWNGSAAPRSRSFEARLLWSAKALYVRFEAEQDEPLIISEKANLKTKTMQLWDRDVCEIFLAPDPKQPRKYLEFEVAPNGEWIDLAIDYTGSERRTDWDFKSGMESSARVDRDKVVMAIKVPWSAFRATPKSGDVWMGNLFRCVGKDPTRGYLAWSPTMTPNPNFHVPEKFGEFVFAK